MLRRMLVLAVAVTSAALSGCGTLANVVDRTREEGGQRVYGGVRMELKAGRDFIAECCEPNPMPRGSFFWTGFLLPFDVPLTFIGDTVTLPYTVPCALSAWMEGESRPAPRNLDSPPTPAGSSAE